jgi:prepilin-type N-terminal cleavage/methylation domain-containing protein
MPRLDRHRSIIQGKRHNIASAAAVILNFIFIEEFSIVAIRPPKFNSQGFTLIEMLVTIAVAGIIMGFAVPSFLSLNKPLRDGSLQFKGHLSLIRSKAITSGKAYRLKPKFPNRSDYVKQIPRNFIVEYAANCKVTAVGGTNGWQIASQLDLDLPESIGVTDVSLTAIPASNSLSWNSGKGICFDNRGIVDDTTTVVVLKDFRGDSRAKISAITITKVGGADIITYDNNTSAAPSQISADTQGNPVF